MPDAPGILTEIQDLSPIQKDGDRQLSRLEALPAELGHMVEDHLTGNDLIMLSLVSKTMAFKVDRCRTRLIANIAWYQLRVDEPANRPTEGARRELGVVDISSRDIQGPVSTASKAIHDQSADLRVRVRRGLLLEHGYCYVCNKFRPLAKKYWYDLCEHMEPGSTRSGTGTQRYIEELSRRWALHGSCDNSALCPAHKLLTESWTG